MKKNKIQKAKFFCESCGAEVAQNAKVCNNCGKFFSSVRCPQCGKTGRTEEFIHGCPDCGYAFTPGPAYATGQRLGRRRRKHNSYGNIFRSLGKSGRSSSNAVAAGYDSGLPVWIYIASIAVVICLIICLYSCLN